MQAEAVCRGSWWRRHASHGATPRTPRYATRRAAPRQGRANDRDRRRRCLLPSFFFSLERVAVGASRSRLLKKNSTVNGLVDNVSRYVCTGGNARCNEESGREREREKEGLSFPGISAHGSRSEFHRRGYNLATSATATSFLSRKGTSARR